jgi:hypothetical protein
VLFCPIFYTNVGDPLMFKKCKEDHSAVYLLRVPMMIHCAYYYYFSGLDPSYFILVMRPLHSGAGFAPNHVRIPGLGLVPSVRPNTVGIFT